MENGTLTERLSCLRVIVQYFDENKYFDNIKRQCDDSIHHESLVYIFSIDVNLHDLFEKSALLGEKVLNIPVDSSNLFHEVIFEYIKCQQLLAPSITSSQVLAKLCITHLPCKKYLSSLKHICSLSDLTKHANYKGFVKLTGIVSGFSGVTKYTQSTRYVCSDSTCNGHYGNHFIRIHIPGALETQTVRSDFMCTFCGRILEETISSRILSDKMVADVLPIKIEGHQRKESMRSPLTQAVPVILRDELVNMIEIGKSYVIIGICQTDYSEEEITITLEANSVTEIHRSMCDQTYVNGDLQKFIDCIYHDSNENGWRFLSLLALHFASNIVPLGKMVKLRLLLLISLVLYPQENKLHILAVGRETEQALQVMKYAEQFSCRSCPVSSAMPLNGKVSNKYQWAPYFLEGGSQLLSHGGVCFFGEIGLWKKTKKEEVKNMLTSNKVMIELAPKYTEGLPQTITFPLNCQNWAIHEVYGAKLQAGSSNNSDVFTGCPAGDLTKSFLDAFSVVAFLDENVSSYDEESDLDYLDFMWRQYCCDLEAGETPLRVETDDFEKYLSHARRQDTKMSVEAEILLHSYFSASRLARTTGFGASGVPPSALITLTSLAVGISKLLLHKVVTESDAILAIYLYEEYLTSRWGLSVLSIQRQPDIASYEMDNFLGRQNDQLMQQFTLRLQQFCTRVKDSISFNEQKFTNEFAFKEE